MRRTGQVALVGPRARRRLPRAAPLALLPIAVLGLAVAGVGLGREEQPAPDVSRPLPVVGYERTDLGGGIRVDLPARPWTITRDRAPLLAYASGGPATVAVWRYPRRERLPRTRAELRRAERGLLEALRRRDPGFRLQASAVTRIAGVPAIQIRAEQTILGQRRTARSTHLYAGRSEIVVDAYAPARDFRAVDRTVVRTAVRSLRLSPAARRGGPVATDR